MMHGYARAFLVCKITILRESRKQARLRRRYLPFLKGDPIEQSHDALRAGSQIMERLRRKLDRPEIANPSLAILTLEIALDDQFAVLENKKTVDIPHAPLSDCLIEPSDHVGGEFVRRKRGLLLPQRW